MSTQNNNSYVITAPPPGIYRDVPADVYHRWDAANASMLKLANEKTWRHVKWARENPKPPSPAMVLGSVAHLLTLEPDKVEGRVIIAGECCSVTGKGSKCGNAGKFYRDGQWFCGVHSRGISSSDDVPKLSGEDGEVPAIITQEAFNTAKAMSLSLRNDHAARDLIDNSIHEVSIVWEDPVTHVLCKARFDGWDESGFRILDIKTCSAAGEDDFEKQIGDFGYHIQAAMYLDAAMAATEGVEHDAFYFLAVESDAPHVQAVWKAHRDLVSLGRHRYRQLLADYKVCREEDVWPGYHDHQALPIGLTRYFFDKESRR